MKFFLLCLIFATSACSGASEYRVLDEHMIAGSEIIYLTVAKQNTTQTDPRLVVLSPSSNSQQDLATLFSVSYFAAMSGNTPRRNLLPTATPLADKRGAPSISITGPKNEIAYVWLQTDQQASTVEVWRAGRATPLDVGPLNQGLEIGVSALGVTLFRPGDLQFAHFRWEGPVPTEFAAVPITKNDDEAGLEFVSLSPSGSHAVFRIEGAPTRLAVFTIPSGQRVDTHELSAVAQEIVWMTDSKLLTTVKSEGKTRTTMHELGTAAATDLDFEADLKRVTRFPMSDVLLLNNVALTPDGNDSRVDKTNGIVIEGRRGWSVNANGDITAYDFDRKSSRSLGRLRGKVELIGKNGAGLIIIGKENPARVWIVNPEVGTRRDVVVTTTTADGVVEVDGRN